MAKQSRVTEYQTRVYTLLQQIPPGRITSYNALAKALNSSPRAVGGALRNNPFAPEIPCHRVVATSGFIGGYKGDWQNVPSGQNQTTKQELLSEEGVLFDARGMLVERGRFWDGFDLKKV